MSYVRVEVVNDVRDREELLKMEQEYCMNFPQKQIFINNFQNVEEYLGYGLYAEKQLSALRLERNLQVPGVRELLRRIPDGYDSERMREFYEETGLRIQVEYYNKECEVTRFDKDGRYPREDAALWNKDFMNDLQNHPEWLEPQEEPDLLIRYIPAGAGREIEREGE